MTHNIRCSVVIPTLNRPEAVRNLIADVKRQTYTNIEIVVVDQSAVLDQELSRRAEILYVHLETPNTPHARNCGTDKASGDIIVFFDDDSRISDAHVLSKTVDFFTQHPEYAGVGFTVEDVNADLNKENQQVGTRIMRVSPSGKVWPFARGEEQDVTAPRGGGMAFWRSAIVRVGGFDERYVGNAMREETDFTLRIVKHIGKIRYLPAVSVTHLGLSSGGSRSKNRLGWYRDFFANEFLFQLTHTRRLYLIHFFLRKLRPILACMLYYGKCRPSALLVPINGFRDGYSRYAKQFRPFHFSR